MRRLAVAATDVVAKSVISKEQAARTADRVWTYANQDAEDPSTWYGKGGIMIVRRRCRSPPVSASAINRQPPHPH